jgi:dTDP-4-amino-4,6-dideoxygalactose transaminase
MTVPLLDVRSQNLALEAELKAAFERVLRSGQYILGPELERFERQVAELTDTRHAIGVSSGTDALLLALMTLGLGPGDEVLCPTFTFIATAGGIARVGATPVFVDSCPVCFNLDVQDAAAKVTPQTKAIIPVHLFGQAAEMDAVLALARQHGLFVIEDAAQALGAAYRGRKVGSLGTLGCLSFYPSKNLGGFGDAGMLLTNDDALAAKAHALRNHGAERRYFHRHIGGNFRLDPLQAALLSVKLPHLPAYTHRRRERAIRYTESLAKLPGVVSGRCAQSACTDAQAHASDAKSSGSDRPGPSGPPRVPGRRSAMSEEIVAGQNSSSENAPRPTHPGSAACPRLILPSAYPHNDHVWNQYTIRVLGDGRRDALKHLLAARGIGSETYYPLPLHAQQCFANRWRLASERSRACPVAERLASECLSLPVYPELDYAQQDRVIETVGEFVQQ